MTCTGLTLIPSSAALQVLIIGAAAAAFAACLLLAATARAHPDPCRRRARSTGLLAPGSDNAHEAGATRILIVGAGARGRELAQAIIKSPDLRLQIVGFVDDQPDLPGWDGIPILGAARDITEVVERHRVDEIMVAHAPSWQEALMSQLMSAGQDERVRVTSVLSMRDAMTADLRLRQIADIPLVAVNGHHPPPTFRTAKRCLDVAFSLVGLALGGPVIALLALLVKAASRGPAFFCQRRVGLHGKEFTIYKLRTMIADAERETGPVLADARDERVTPLGRILRRTRLDETPQLLNVLKGEMSMVGPRPERPEFTSRYLREIPGYAKRLSVKPGITGLAQVRGGYAADVYSKLKYDWVYVYRQSLWLDLRILLGTVRVVLLCAGQ
jgi:exopolysaccharide biosynthesis polyprenyl glycosylphosphotransferase